MKSDMRFSAVPKAAVGDNHNAAARTRNMQQYVLSVQVCLSAKINIKNIYKDLRSVSVSAKATFDKGIA